LVGSLSATPVDRPLADYPDRGDQRAGRHCDNEPRDIPYRHECLATRARSEPASGKDRGFVSGGGAMGIIRSTSDDQGSKRRATDAQRLFAIATSRVAKQRREKDRSG
jgi:hypothetical protein